MKTRIEALTVVALVVVAVFGAACLVKLGADDNTRTPLVLRSNSGNFDPDLRFATYDQGTKADSAYAETSTATNANTASKIVKRDSSGNFSAGTITAALTGIASGNIPSTSLSLDTALGASTTLVPCQNAVKVYADTKATATTAAKIYSGAAAALPLTNTVKKGDIYISDEGNAYICCALGADTSGWKQAN